MNEIFKKRIKQSIIDNGLSDTLQVTDIFLDDALNIIGKDYIRQNLHKLMIDLKNYVLADLGWYGGVVINDLYGWDEGIDFMQNTDRLAIIDYVSLEGIDYTWYDVDMEENMGYMSMSWSDEKLLERPEVMIELFNFLCDFYRQRFEGGREDDRFMMEQTNLRDKIKRILREEIKQNMGIHEVFDAGQMPELLRKVKKEGKVIYQYSLPSKKSDENYYINLTFYKNFDEFKLKDVLDLDFDLGESGEKKYSGLNEIFYLFTSINKVIEKHKKDFKYLIIFSSQDRLSLYEKVLSRIDYLNLDKKGGNFILYKNNDYSKWL